MAVLNSMNHVNRLVEALLAMHKDGKVEIVRTKDRFVQAPSTGGWRDLVIQPPPLSFLSFLLADVLRPRQSSFLSRRSSL